MGARSARAETGGAIAARAGYSHFGVEAGLIRRHRSIADDVRGRRLRQPRPSSSAGIRRGRSSASARWSFRDGRVLLVKRRYEPLAGQWSLPGGMLELGETLEAGVAREMLEETGLVVDVGPVVEVFDRILLDDTGGSATTSC